MSKSKVSKKIMTLLVLCMLLATNLLSVSAHEVEDNEVIILNNVDEIELYNCADGTYETYLEDGSCIQITIKTTDIVESGISTYATEYIQNKSFNYRRVKSNGDLDWRSEVSATFHYNETYVWCTAGIAYSEFGVPSKSSISYSLNEYSSAKVTGVSKYQIKAKIKTPTGTYDISQYVGSDPMGNMYDGISL